MLRAAFWLTALLLVPLGLLLYFFPADAATRLGVSPLWLLRGAGGLLLAWGGFQVAASTAPDGVKVGGLVGGNLLMVAALLPAALRFGSSLGGAGLLLWVLVGWLALAALLALLSVPLGRSAGRADAQEEPNDY